ncbi:MAG: InlB B-repeat-containing protein [Oscillospiraceae bacterium]|nr:InlB B-repeat-containing protein [Oscillospiraceae bacterium]
MKKKLISMLLIVVLMFTMIPAAFAASCTVKFYANGGSGSMSDQTSDSDGNIGALSANTFTRDGYSFTGWNTANDGSGTPYADGAAVSGMTADMTLYAQWSIDTYTITYNLDGGTSGNPTTYTLDTLPITLQAPTKEGYTFSGWTGQGITTNPNVTIDSSMTGVPGDLSFSAAWTKDSEEGGEEGGGSGGSGGSGGTPVIEVNGKPVDPSIAKTVQEAVKAALINNATSVSVKLLADVTDSSLDIPAGFTCNVDSNGYKWTVSGSVAGTLNCRDSYEHTKNDAYTTISGLGGLTVQSQSGNRTGVVNVYSGIIDTDPSTLQENGVYIRNAYEKLEGNKWWIRAGASGQIATLNSTGYPSLQAAFTESVKTGGTDNIRLRLSNTENVTATYTQTKTVYLDLGGKKLTGDITIDGPATVYVRNGVLDGTISGGAKIIVESGYYRKALSVNEIRGGYFMDNKSTQLAKGFYFTSVQAYDPVDSNQLYSYMAIRNLEVTEWVVSSNLVISDADMYEIVLDAEELYNAYAASGRFAINESYGDKVQGVIDGDIKKSIADAGSGAHLKVVVNCVGLPVATIPQEYALLNASKSSNEGIGAIYNITIDLKLVGDYREYYIGTLTKLRNPIDLTIVIPSGLRMSGRSYRIASVHDMKVYNYKTTVSAHKATADDVYLFSPFAIIVNGGNGMIPLTGDSGDVVTWALVSAGALLALAGATVLLLRKKRSSI